MRLLVRAIVVVNSLPDFVVATPKVLCAQFDVVIKFGQKRELEPANITVLLALLA